MSPDKPEHQNKTEEILIVTHVQPLTLLVILSYLINLQGIFNFPVPGKNKWELGTHLSYALETPPLLILQSTEHMD